MRSDNPSSADNQQERLGSSAWLNRVPQDLGHYIAGFVDGEGSFNVPIRRERDRLLPFPASLSFNVSQIGAEAPELLRSTFGIGTVRGRRDGVFYFEITKPTELEARVFPFFDRWRAPGDVDVQRAITRILVGLVQKTALADNLAPRSLVTVRAESDSGHTVKFKATIRIDSPLEIDQYRNGGILPLIMRRLLAS